MDASELAVAARKALEFRHTIGECEFVLRIPTRLEVRECIYRRELRTDAGEVVSLALLERYLLDDHLLGWTGVRMSHVLPDAGAAPLAWSREMIGVLMDAQPDWADELGGQLIARMGKRNAQIEADSGN